MSCAVKGCTHSRRFKPENISFHSFPRQGEILKSWLRILGKDITTWTWSKNKLVCSLHFADDDFIGGGRKFLRPNAVPTVERSKATSSKDRPEIFFVDVSFQSDEPKVISPQIRSGDIKRLFQRLREANKQAELLRSEINSIKEDIQALTKCEIFSQHTNNFSDSNSSSESSDTNDDIGDGPPVKKQKYEFTEDDGYVVVYTDGACEKNGSINAKAGLGVWFGENHPLNVSRPVKGKATNNAGEIQACIHAVKIAQAHGIKKLKILSDSQFTINSMTKWIHGWKKNNWKLAGGKGDVKNQVDFKELDKLCQSVDVKWEYVAGHTGTRGNEEADRLAREGARFYVPQN